MQRDEESKAWAGESSARCPSTCDSSAVVTQFSKFDGMISVLFDSSTPCCCPLRPRCPKAPPTPELINDFPQVNKSESVLITHTRMMMSRMMMIMRATHIMMMSRSHDGL